MKIAFCLFKYSPYSGLSLDFLRILEECQKRDHDPYVFVSEWRGERPEGVQFMVLKPSKFSLKFSNHAQNEQFHNKLQAELKKQAFDVVVGFNKMPGLDLYYGADSCYVGDKVPQYPAIYKLTRRYKGRYSFEQAVFGVKSQTLILSLSEQQKSEYQEHYFTPNKRFHLLPPTLDASFSPITDRATQKEKLRAELGLPINNLLLMFIGSGFRTKGLARAITALAGLPIDLQQRSSLIVVGHDDDEKQYRKQADRVSVSQQVLFLGGRSRQEIPKLLAAGDLMVHPAHNENTGTVLLEAIAAGLPVLATDVCGYAHHIKAAEAGIVLDSPFDQEALNTRLASMITSPYLDRWSANGQRYGTNPALYKMPASAVDAIEAYEQRNISPINCTPGSQDIHNIYLREDLGQLSFDELLEIGKNMIGGHHNVVEARDKLGEEGRRTVSFSHNGERYYLKIHDGVGWKEIGKNLTSLRLPVLGAENEWKGVHHLRRQTLLQNLGLNTLNIAGYGTRERRFWKILNNPAKRQSLIVTDEIPEAISLEDLFKDKLFWGRNANKIPIKICFKRWLIEQLAQTARVLHNSGANHRDFYLSHFLLQRTKESHEPTPENSSLFLIDLHRMQIHKPRWTAWIKAILQGALKLQRPHPPESVTPRRWKMRDVSGLHYSSMDLGLTKRDLIRFISTYENISNRQVLEALQANDGFWRDVRSRAQNLYRSEKRRTRKTGKVANTPLTPASTQH
ncbi:MAG: glycosyltransferase [Arenicellales bacterium]|nr:glycosyltransferase [Arenicellales bacterium]